MTLMLPDLDEQLFEEIPVPCEAIWDDREGHHHCSKDASWVVRTVCHCGHTEVDLLCDEHYQTMVSLPEAGGEFWRFICSACGCHGRSVSRHAEPL